MRRVARSLILAFAFAAGTASGPAVPAAAASPPPAEEPPSCQLRVEAEEVDAAHLRYSVVFSALATGTFSGTVALYAGSSRYDVPFDDVVAVDTRDNQTRRTPIIVAFPVPVVVDAAAVIRLTKPEPIACTVPFSPWRRNRFKTAYGYERVTAPDPKAAAAYRAWAQTAPAVAAPPPVDDPAPCTRPDRPSETTDAFVPESPPILPPSTPLVASAVVLVVVNGNDTISGARIERSSGNDFVDRMALGAALQSKFRGETFRCKHVVGAYLYGFTFTR